MVREYFERMSATVAQPQKDLLRELLKAGRWTNESEIVRYGIELVKREVEREALSPVPNSELAACYASMSQDDKASESQMAKRVVRPTSKDLE